MKTIVLLLVLIGLTILSCNNEETNKDATKEENQPPKTESGLSCYSKQDRDTIVLSLHNFTDSVSGSLQYHI